MRFERPATELAPALLGLWVVRKTAQGITAAMITETEAYAGREDRASHARAGATRRTAPMFGPAGHAYVYLVYGMYSCLNVVAERDGEAAAVLIRAVSPMLGVGLIRERRGRPQDRDQRLAAGPAMVCDALDVDRSLDGHDLTLGTELWLADADPTRRAEALATGIVTGPRIGVAYAGEGWADRAWRFGLRGHPSLSKPFPVSLEASAGRHRP